MEIEPDDVGGAEAAGVPNEDPVPAHVAEAIAGVADAIARVADLEVTDLSGEALLATVRELEVLRRRLDAATGRVVDEVDRTGAPGIDGHRTTAAAIRHLGRASGPEAAARVRTARSLRLLPLVAAAWQRGQIPTGMVHAIARVASNPRVRPHLAGLDPILAELATTEDHDGLVSWLRQWESLADSDGVEPEAERTHRRRRASVARNDADGSTCLRLNVGGLQGAILADVLAHFEQAELETDRAEAIARLGESATPADYARTAAQRRADAVLAIFRRAAATPAEDRSPEPLVNVIIDQRTFEAELARAAGQPTDDAPPTSATRTCRTATGHPLHPSDALAAALVGHIRRVVVDAASQVIDLGRKRRLFTGSSREAAIIQAAISDPAGVRCLWSGCNSPPAYLQIDHLRAWHAGGSTDVANSSPLCGHHNRLKEAGFRPVRAPDGTWTFHRPDGGGTITRAA